MSILYSFVIILIGKGELVALFVLLVFYDCCVALPHSATGLSAVCDCGISCMIILTYYFCCKANKKKTHSLINAFVIPSLVIVVAKY